MKKTPLARRVVAAIFCALFAVLPVLGLSALGGCPGTTTAVSCKRNADGSVECGVEVHRDGNHNKPVK